MPAGKMLMVSKVQDEFHCFFCFDREEGLGNSDKSQDYLVSCPELKFWYMYLDFKPKSR